MVTVAKVGISETAFFSLKIVSRTLQTTDVGQMGLLIGGLWGLGLLLLGANLQGPGQFEVTD